MTPTEALDWAVGFVGSLSAGKGAGKAKPVKRGRRAAAKSAEPTSNDNAVVAALQSLQGAVEGIAARQDALEAELSE